MFRKMLGVFTAVTAALVFVGVAWATSDDSGATGSSLDASSSSSISADSSTSSTSGAVTSTSNPNASSSTTSDTTVTTNPSTTSTSVASTTSTSTGSSTSTSSDDSETSFEAGLSTHVIAGVGSVTVEVADGRLILISWSAPGWALERQRVEADRIELEWVLGEAEAEFEARLENGRLRVETEHDSD